MIATVEAFIEAWNERDRDTIASMLHADALVHGIPLPPAVGRDAAMALLDSFLAAEAIDWRIVHIASAGSLVFTERVDRFRFAGHAWTEVRAAGVFEFSSDGLITAWRDYFDMAELVAALPANDPSPASEHKD